MLRFIWGSNSLCFLKTCLPLCFYSLLTQHPRRLGNTTGAYATCVQPSPTSIYTIACLGDTLSGPNEHLAKLDEVAVVFVVNLNNTPRVCMTANFTTIRGLDILVRADESERNLAGNLLRFGENLQWIVSHGWGPHNIGIICKFLSAVFGMLVSRGAAMIAYRSIVTRYRLPYNRPIHRHISLLQNRPRSFMEGDVVNGIHE